MDDEADEAAAGTGGGVRTGPATNRELKVTRRPLVALSLEPLRSVASTDGGSSSKVGDRAPATRSVVGRGLSSSGSDIGGGSGTAISLAPGGEAASWDAIAGSSGQPCRAVELRAGDMLPPDRRRGTRELRTAGMRPQRCGSPPFKRSNILPLPLCCLSFRLIVF